VRGAYKRVEVIERAVDGIDAVVVRDVVAEVRVRRRVDGRQPDRVGAELLDVVEARRNAAQVADAVPVRVLKGTRVDLVDDGVAPESLSRSALP
jgi:hypothetical protein